ncbi:MAG: tubulin-like doman-containing protein [Verrucomicrobiota bacterium]
MHNHLIIGLGGTGGKVIRAFRRAIYEEYRSKAPLQRTKDQQGRIVESAHPIKLGYLYIDSDASLMEPDEPTWKIPGDTLQLGRASQLQITGANLTGILENLGAYPQIAPWIGERQKWQDIIGSVGGALGGQKRRLGRFLFACKAGDKNEGFVRKLQHQVDELKKQSGQVEINFHICCGLAGGTGSGSVIDVISQIRRIYHEDYHRVIVYALLPDTQPPAGWDTGNYHANGYAALAELNALSVGAFHPFDVVEARGPVTFRDASNNPVSPLNGCYIFTNENERGKVLSLDRDEVSQLVAGFLYQKTIVVNDTEWAGELRRIENAENGDGLPESTPGTNVPQRSKRFLTFGMKRLVIPEEEIREFITFQFGRQAALQLQYNNWSDTHQGYLDTPTNEAFAQFVADTRNHERWKMTDSHICLESGILPMEINENWQPIEHEWNTAVTGFAQVAMKGQDTSWMAKLTELCEKRFEQLWRGKGIKPFFQTKRGDLADQGRAIRQNIEHELFADWIGGKRAMFDLGRIVSELKNVLKEKADYCQRKVAEFRGLVEEDKGKSTILSNIRENNVTWAKIGPLSGLFGKREKTIQAQAEVFKQFYAAKHRIEAWSYASGLANQIQAELEALAGVIATNVSMLKELVEGEANAGVQNRFVGLKERIEARCRDGTTADLNDQVVKFYKPDIVKEFTTKLVRNEDFQSSQTNAVRQAMLGRLGDAPNFTVFQQRLNKGVILDLLEKVCGQEAEKAHNQLIAEDPRTQRILGNNIVDQLYRDYGSNVLQLEGFIRELVARAGNYLTFEPMEEQKTTPGAGPRTVQTDFTVIIPGGSDHPEFREHIQNAFKKAHGVEINFVNGPKSNEITIISIKNLFPLRYAKQVRFLEERYNKRIKEFDRAKLELHSEGDGTSLPPVFLLGGEVIGEHMLTFLLLGRAMKLARDLEDPQTGGKAIYLVTKDDRGRDNVPVLLGQSEHEIVERRDPTVLSQIEGGVRKLLESEYLHKSKREGLLNELDLMMKGISESIPNPLDKQRKAYRDAVDRAEQLLK